MIDKYFLQKLTTKGKIAFFIIQLILDSIFLFILFYVLDYNLGNIGSSERESTYLILFPGILLIAVISGFICLQKWKVEES